MNIDQASATSRRILHKPRTAPVLTAEPPEWTRGALCAQVDPELFYPEKGGRSTSALAVCRECPVTLECLAYGMSDPHGIYGGLSARQRQRLGNTA